MLEIKHLKKRAQLNLFQLSLCVGLAYLLHALCQPSLASGISWGPLSARSATWWGAEVRTVHIGLETILCHSRQCRSSLYSDTETSQCRLNSLCTTLWHDFLQCELTVGHTDFRAQIIFSQRGSKDHFPLAWFWDIHMHHSCTSEIHLCTRDGWTLCL